MKKLLPVFTLVCLVLVSCSSKDDTSGGPSTIFNTDHVSLYANDTYQLFEGSSGNITSSNTYVATISSSGLITANYVGTAQIRGGSSTCNVTVNPKSRLYSEPFFDWGASVADIKAKAGSNPYSESETSLIYELSGDIALGYMFTDNRLTGISALVGTAKTTELSTYISERYKMIYYDPDEEIVAMYMNGNTRTEATVAVGLSLPNLDYWMVMYIPANSTRAFDFHVTTDIFEKYFAGEL